jgi:hypothetical protein
MCYLCGVRGVCDVCGVYGVWCVCGGWSVLTGDTEMLICNFYWKYITVEFEVFWLIFNRLM